MEIIPAIMPIDFADITAKSDAVHRLVKTIHIDAMNGTITHRSCWPFSEEFIKEFNELTSGAKSLPNWKEVDYEVDVMMKDPEDSFAEWVNAGFKRVIVHLESTQKFSALVREWKGVVEIGAAIDLDTGIEELRKAVAAGADFVQFMCIPEIGYQGTGFDKSVLKKIAEFHREYPNVIISADGGVNGERLLELAEVGVTRFVMGSAIFKHREPAEMTEAIEKFKSLAETAQAVNKKT